MGENKLKLNPDDTTTGWELADPGFDTSTFLDGQIPIEGPGSQIKTAL